MDRLKIAQYIALAATLFTVIGSLLGAWSGSVIGNCFLSAGFITALVSYIFGGFGTAVSSALNIAKWGWIVVPFPYDIPVFIMTALVAIIVFCLLPIIPVRIAYTKSH